MLKVPSGQVSAHTPEESRFEQVRQFSAEPEQLVQDDKHASFFKKITFTSWSTKAKEKKNRKRTFARRAIYELSLWARETMIGGAGTTGAR
jgi:hypothetical protein